MTTTASLTPARKTTSSGADRGGSRARADRSRPFRLTLPLIFFLLFTLVPFYWIVLFAFRDSASRSLLPVPFTFENISYAWNELHYDIYFQNSIIVAIASMAGTTLIAVAGGYAIARYSFRWKAFFLLALLCTQFIPGAMLLIPLFNVFQSLGLINNFFSLIIANVVFELPLAVVLMSSFIAKIPFELEEAAMVDGASRIRGFFMIVFPQLRPAIVAIGSFTFIGAWNAFLFALMFLSKQDLFTIPVGLSYTIGEQSVNYGVMAAGGLLAAVPVVIVFAFIQKYLVQGLSGALKG